MLSGVARIEKNHMHTYIQTYQQTQVIPKKIFFSVIDKYKPGIDKLKDSFVKIKGFMFSDMAKNNQTDRQTAI